MPSEIDQSFLHWGKYVFDIKIENKTNLILYFFNNFYRWISFNISIYEHLFSF